MPRHDDVALLELNRFFLFVDALSADAVNQQIVDMTHRNNVRVIEIQSNINHGLHLGPRKPGPAGAVNCVDVVGLFTYPPEVPTSETQVGNLQLTADDFRNIDARFFEDSEFVLICYLLIS